MRRLLTTLALGSCLLACQLVTGEPVQLLTGVDSCWAGGETGVKSTLLVDPDYGTSFDGMPVMWPVGFTGLRIRSEVRVLDKAGNLVATTGKEYFMSRGRVESPESAKLVETLRAFPAAANCPYPWDLVDCGSTASPSPYCGAASGALQAYARKA